MRPSAAGLAFVACLGVAALAGCATSPPQPDPVQLKLASLDARMTRVERVVDNRSLLGLANQLAATRADLRSVHNSLDQLRHRLNEDRKRERDLYADLDARLSKLEAQNGGAGTSAAAPTASSQGVAAATPGSSPPQGSAATSAAGADQAAYQSAFDLLKAGHYGQAGSAFKQFLAAYPDSSYADNAQYWLGETYYVNRDFKTARREFQTVIDRYGRSSKLPDAMLNVGYCDDELHRMSEAKRVLHEVLARFPGTSAAHLAAQRLAKIKSEHH